MLPQWSGITYSPPPIEKAIELAGRDAQYSMQKHSILRIWMIKCQVILPVGRA